MVDPGLQRRDGFEKRSTKHELMVVDRDAQTFNTRHSFNLEAVRPVRFYERRYRWTGTGVESDPVFVTGVDQLGYRRHRLHGPVLREGQSRIFLVNLGHLFNPGDQETVEFTHTFIDIEKTFEPRLGIATHNEMAQVELRVVLPIEIESNVFIEEHVTGQHGAIDRHSITGITSDDGRYSAFEWRTDTPKVGMTYQLTWTM